MKIDSGISPTWSAFRRLSLRLSAPVLAETLDGGQAFRWYRTKPDEWTGTFGHHVVRLRLAADGAVKWSVPLGRERATEAALTAYLGDEATLAAQRDHLPWRSDSHLAGCLADFSGLRILRQPFGETLLGFLCSATKQIVQIKQMVGLLAEHHGEALLPATFDAACPVALRFRLPTWDEIAAIPETELRACQLGFRARYIHQTARFLAAHPGWLDETEHLAYAAAKERLCSLPGVGEKVADCVLLFGAGRLEAFPVDTWILKAMARRYGLEGWKPTQVAHFGRTHFGPGAGLAQQYLFAWERQAAKPLATQSGSPKL